MEITDGLDAEREATEAARVATESPLVGLVDRVKLDPKSAFDAAVLAAALAVREGDQLEWFVLQQQLEPALKAHKSSLKVWLKAIETHRKAALKAAGPAPEWVGESIVTNPEDPHERTGFGWDMRPGELFRTGKTKEQIAGFSAVIESERVVFDGTEEHREYVIDARVAEIEKRVRITAKEFASMSWVGVHLGARAWISPGKSATDEVRVAIQRLSGKIRLERAYAMIGWRRVEGAWCYHHATGAIDREGVVKDCVASALPRFAASYDLPEPPEGDREREVLLDAIKCFDIHGAASKAVFALVWRAVLGSTQVSLHVAGGAGSGKSELAAIAQRHFGRTMGRRNLPMSWALASENALARAQNIVGDAVLTIDDLVIKGARSEEHLMQRVDAVFRGAWNGQGMERLARDGSMRASRPPRSAVLSTGETVPTGYSLRQRVCVIDLERSPTDYRPAMASAERGDLAAAMAGYIRWVAGRMEKLAPELPSRDLRNAQPFLEYGDRISQAMGALMVGVQTLAQYAESIIPTFDRAAFVSRCAADLHKIAKSQSVHQIEENPALRFRELILDAISEGSAHLTAMDGASAPEPPSASGWQLGRDVPLAEKDQDGAMIGTSRAEAWRPLGKRIGQRDPAYPDVLLLDPGPALDVARAIAVRRGNAFPFSSHRELAQRCLKAGILFRTDINTARQTFTSRATIRGQRVDRLWIELAPTEEV